MNICIRLTVRSTDQGRTVLTKRLFLVNLYTEIKSLLLNLFSDMNTIVTNDDCVMSVHVDFNTNSKN